MMMMRMMMMVMMMMIMIMIMVVHNSVLLSLTLMDQVMKAPGQFVFNIFTTQSHWLFQNQNSDILTRE